MRHFYIILFLLTAWAVGANAQTTVKMSAVKANNFGVTYSLPKTSVVVTVCYTKTTRKAGDFYQYAERYLNVANPITKNETTYRLDRIDATTKSIVDKDKSYLVELRPGSTAAFVTLTNDGLICAINSDYSFAKEEANRDDTLTVAAQLPNANQFLSEEILRAGSSAKQAELIAKQIYRLRESRTNILTGEADNMPPDGAAYKVVMQQLDEQEKALTFLFAGSETNEMGWREFVVVPDSKNIDNKIVLRFSSKLGVVDASDLAGAPVYFSLTNKNPQPEQLLTPKEEKAIADKFSKGIIYNIPSKAGLKIIFDTKTYLDKECDVVQYGSQDVLVNKLFDNNKQLVKVLFYPDLGAIKQIIQ